MLSYPIELKSNQEISLRNEPSYAKIFSDLSFTVFVFLALPFLYLYFITSQINAWLHLKKLKVIYYNESDELIKSNPADFKSLDRSHYVQSDHSVVSQYYRGRTAEREVFLRARGNPLDTEISSKSEVADSREDTFENCSPIQMLEKLATFSILERGSQIVEYFESYVATINKLEGFTELVTLYLEPNEMQPRYYSSPHMLNITFYVLSLVDNEKSDLVLSDLINSFSIVFSLNELRLIRNRIRGKFEPNNSGTSPLLLSYITEDFEKFHFYLDIGFSLEIPYETVRIVLIHNDFGDRMHTDKFYYAKRKYAGKKLSEVIELRHPHLVRTYKTNN